MGRPRVGVLGEGRREGGMEGGRVGGGWVNTAR